MIAWIILLAVLVWIGYEAIGVRDVAQTVCRNTCRQVGVQLVDQTVSLKSLSLSRPNGDSLKIARRYRFEFSETGADRRAGQLALSGRRPDWVEFARSDGHEMITFP